LHNEADLLSESGNLVRLDFISINQNLSFSLLIESEQKTCDS